MNEIASYPLALYQPEKGQQISTLFQTIRDQVDRTNSYPILLWGPERKVEIPDRFRDSGGLKSLIQRTRKRFSSDSFTIDELVDLIGNKAITDVSQVQNLNLVEALFRGNTAVIQLADNMRWRISCLMEIFGNGYSAIQKMPKEKHVGVFHTGSHMPFGVITKQYLIHDPVPPNVIWCLLLKQKQQPDPTVWMGRTF